ncbi:hypothetical protein BLOT_003601 [Blomia tropicalis]|nr:hypothetical protein BLOT_003601 [Blomia tropicalis]
MNNTTFLAYYFLLLCLASSIHIINGILVSRNDNNFDLILYVNGQPLKAFQQLNLQAYQQTGGILFPNGQKIPPTIQIVHGKLKVIPSGSYPNMYLTIQRT